MFQKPVVALFLCLLAASFSASSCPKKSYSIGIQAMDYSPHYNGDDLTQPTFFNDFITWLSKKTDCTFEIVPLPVKRLTNALERKKIDFIYPGNPDWHQENKENNNNKYWYSPTIAFGLGGTMVLPANQKMMPASFASLAFPRGFTPIAFYPLRKKHYIDFIEVSDAYAAYMMVVSKRATGADIEYNVAQHTMAKHKLPPLALADNLPFTLASFHLMAQESNEFTRHISSLIQENPEQLTLLRKNAKLLESRPTNVH